MTEIAVVLKDKSFTFLQFIQSKLLYYEKRECVCIVSAFRRETCYIVCFRTSLMKRVIFLASVGTEKPPIYHIKKNALETFDVIFQNS